MKITDDILKALQSCIDGVGSAAKFAEKANIKVETIGKYLSRQTKTIADDTWEQIYPLIRPYLPKDQRAPSANGGHHKAPELTSNQKIFLDALAELPEDVQNKKVIEIVELAKQALQKKRSS